MSGAASLFALALLGAVTGQPAAPPAASDWRTLDPETVLLIDTSAGRVVVEMRPDLAPLAVERIKRLARAHTYDGLLFHRVIEGFVDQTGNPNNHDGGGTDLPNLPPEFTARLDPAQIAKVAEASDASYGFLGSVPVETEAPARMHDGRLRAWGAYCPGVAGMGRQADPASANSELFFMREAARRLDGQYTVWGRTVIGLDALRHLAVGVPPDRPDRMIRVRVAADLPAQERPTVRVLDPRRPAFQAQVRALRHSEGADFTLCDVPLAARID